MKHEYQKVWHRDYSLWYFGVFHRAISTNDEKDLFVFPELIVLHQTVYLPLDKAKTLEKHACNTWKDFEAYLENIKTFGKKHIESAKRLGEASIEDIETAIKLHNQFFKDTIAYTYYLWCTFHIVETIANETYRLLQKYPEVLEGEKTQQLLKGTHVPAHERLLKDARNASEDRLRELHQEYKWMSCIDPQTPPLTYEKFLEIATGTLGEAKELDTDDLPFTDEEKEFVKLAKRSAYLKDLRDDLRRQAFGAAYPYFERLSHERDLDAKHMRYLTAEETDMLLKDELSNARELAESRMEDYLIRNEDGQSVVLHGKELRDAIQDIRILREERDEIKGLIGRPGKIRGTARIILTTDDLPKVEEGDILVAITTHQDYVAGMKKAAAIVTDEGGITCHAAIVSRELGKPCIVGTGNATANLRDGDQIEVDANNGIARRIE